MKGYNPFDHFTALHRVLYPLRVFRYYINGDTLGSVFRWWNPLSYPISIILVLILLLLGGLREVMEDFDDGWFGWRVDKWFRNNDRPVIWTTKRTYFADLERTRGQV